MAEPNGSRKKVGMRKRVAITDETAGEVLAYVYWLPSGGMRVEHIAPEIRSRVVSFLDIPPPPPLESGEHSPHGT